MQVTALSLATHDAAMDDLRRTLGLGGLVILAVEALVVGFLAGRLVRPLEGMATAVNKIADGALDTRVDTTGGSREVAELSADIGRMVERLGHALDEQQRSAAEATQARDDMQRFLADVSHEIRTPLSALKGYSDLYARGMLAEPGALDRAMGRVGSESVRLHALVNTMLDLTRGGDREVQVADVDVEEVARAVLADLRVVFPQRRIDLEVDVAPEARVEGDPARLHQAVLNMGANACSHTPATTPVLVLVRCTRSLLTISVVDQGPGIDETERVRVFLPFLPVGSLSGSRRSQRCGTGIGGGPTGRAGAPRLGRHLDDPGRWRHLRAPPSAARGTPPPSSTRPCHRWSQRGFQVWGSFLSGTSSMTSPAWTAARTPSTCRAEGSGHRS